MASMIKNAGDIWGVMGMSLAISEDGSINVIQEYPRALRATLPPCLRRTKTKTKTKSRHQTETLLSKS
jgi:hypothetical protein